MSDYKLTSVSDPRPWTTGRGDEMHGYVLHLEGVDKPVHLNQKPATAAPVVGQTMALDLTPHKHFDDALQAKRAQLGGFGGGKAEDPKRSAAIGRMHDQDMGLRTVEIATKLGLIQPQSTGELFELVAKTADWFAKDTAKARDAA